eukprot:6938646-Pyramimonas_sp.AAC.1
MASVLEGAAHSGRRSVARLGACWHRGGNADASCPGRRGAAGSSMCPPSWRSRSFVKILRLIAKAA